MVGMLADIAPSARLILPRRILLKAEPAKEHGKFMHSGKHALYGNPPRWHLITADKPAPKGAPIAANPKAAGDHAPAKHFTDAQWAELKLPDSNVNAPSYNKALEKLKDWSDAGNVTAIVGAGYGSNTYGKKLALIANHLLGLHGSVHKVAAGQKAGEHAAVHGAPAVTDGLQEPGAAAPLAQHVKDTLDEKAAAGDVEFLSNVAKNNPEHPQIVAYAQQKLAEVKGKAPAPAKQSAAEIVASGASNAQLKEWLRDNPGKEGDLVSALDAAFKHHVVLQLDLDESAGAAAAPDMDSPEEMATNYKDGKPVSAAPAALAMPDFAEGKTTTGVKALYESTAKKLIDHALAGNKAVVDDMLAPSKKMWQGKTPNSKKLLALWSVAQAYAAGAGKPADDGPKEGDTKPAADGGTLVLKDGHWVKQKKAVPEIKSDPQTGAPIKPDVGTFHGTLTEIEGWIADGNTEMLKEAASAWAELSSVGAKTSAAYAHAGLRYLEKKKPAPAEAQSNTPDTGPLTAQQLSNLQSIPWFKLKLPAENTNAKSHNAAVAKIEAMAFAGDTAGLQAFIDSKAGAKQTYAKKQALLAQTALAGLQQPGATAAVPVEPAPAPAAPISPIDGWKAAIAAGKVPTKEQAEAYDALVEDDADAGLEAFMDAANSLIPADKMNDEAFDEALQEAHAKVSELHEHALNGTMPAAPIPEPIGAAAPKPSGPAGVDVSGLGDAEKAMLYKLVGENDLNGLEAASKYGAPAAYKKAAGEALAALKAAKPAAPAKVTASAKLYTNTIDGHNKFWAVSVHGSVMKTTYGKNGTKGQETVKQFPSEAAAKAAADKLKSEKQGKGYQFAGYTEHEHEAAPGAAAEQGPKEGDTKMGADGMLVLKDGHWVKASDMPAAPKAAAGKPAAPAGALPSMDDWEQIGPQKGSNPGGVFQDPTGQDWYCKWPSDADAAKSEVLAAKLYALAGLSSQDCMLVSKGGKTAIATKWTTIKKAGSAAALAKVPGVLDGFAVDAWLGNWDVVGMSLDNLQVGPDGKAHRVDAGGSLEYRAQGEKKPFGHKVEEIDTLRDAAKNPHAAAVFGKIKQADLLASVAKVAAISDVAIRAMVNEFGPGDAAAKAKLAETLIARKKDLIAKFPKAAKPKKKPTFDATKISAPPSFLNWGGTGKSGPSSKEFLNKANDDAVQAIFAAAKTGKLDAIKNLTAPVFDKDSGQVTGHKPVLEHPSQHVKGYAQQSINEINYQLNPPKRFRFDGGHPLHALNSAYPAHAGAKSSATAQKLGKFIVLGEPGLVKLEDVGLPAKITHAEGGGTLSTSTYAPAAKAAFHKMPATQKQAIQSYTGSSYHEMNGSLWSGNPSGAAKAAGEALKTLGHDIQPGTVLSRKISLHGEDLQKLLGAKGKVLQEPAIMSTSVRPSSWSGNVHLKLHVGPGVKGLWVGKGSSPNGGSVSKHGGEDEMILPPNTRLLVLSAKAGGSKDADGFGLHSSHVIECIVLPTQ